MYTVHSLVQYTLDTQDALIIVAVCSHSTCLLIPAESSSKTTSHPCWFDYWQYAAGFQPKKYTVRKLYHMLPTINLRIMALNALKIDK